MSRDAIFIRTFGTFEVTAPDGSDLTPRSVKACGLLALLVAAPGLRRSRAFLQDKLWSEREHEQGSASLRQSLSQIRRALKDQKDALTGDARSVGLDPERVRSDWLDADARLAARRAEARFLEDVDIRDPEFEDWLRERRQEIDGIEPAAAPDMSQPVGIEPGAFARIILTEQAVAAMDPRNRMAGGIILQGIASGVSDRATIDSEWNETGERVTAMNALRLDADERMFGDRPNVRLRLLATPSNRVLWQIGETLPPVDSPDLEDALHRIVNEGIDRTLEVLSSPNSVAHRNMLFVQALLRMFQSRGQDFRSIKKVFRDCYEQEPRGIYLAWQAFVNCYAVGERREVDIQALKEEARQLVSEAVKAEPHNPVVLALASHVNGFLLGQYDAAHELAERSVRLDRGGVLGWTFLATSKIFRGDIDEAYRSFVHARRITGEGPYRHLVDSVSSIAAILSGHFDEGIVIGEALNATTPDFAPTLRYLIAAYLKTGRHDRAEDAVLRLRRLEPDFQLSHFAEPDYPVPALRQTGLLDLKALPKLG